MLKQVDEPVFWGVQLIFCQTLKGPPRCVSSQAARKCITMKFDHIQMQFYAIRNNQILYLKQAYNFGCPDLVSCFHISYFMFSFVFSESGIFFLSMR